jgi:branched-subunit amino acid transport protein
VVASPGEPIAASMPKIIAAIVAGAVAFATHGTLRTLLAGMLMLWVLKFAAGIIG